jgi:peptide/nickel transport system permease protein
MNRLTVIGVVIVVVLVFVALFAPWIATYDVGATNLSIRYLPPSAAHWFGTDSTGRDIFSRVVFGARISLQVGIIVVAVSAVIGTLLGAVAGYYGGLVDRFVSGYVFNVFLAFPGLLPRIAMVAFLGAGLNKLIPSRCASSAWVGYARLIRGQVLKVREYDFVQAARALGAATARNLLVPHTSDAIQPLIVQAAWEWRERCSERHSRSSGPRRATTRAQSWGPMMSKKLGDPIRQLASRDHTR